jgi:hypothetical protein
VAGFAARKSKGGITVTWRTANERNIAGFHVWRAGKKLNRRLIAAKAERKGSGGDVPLHRPNRARQRALHVPPASGDARP